MSHAIESDLHKAVGLHQSGRLAEAETIYRTILRKAPKNFDALHLLGVVRLQQGRAAESLDLIEAALRTKPDEPLALSNFGAALLELNRFRDAVDAYRKVLAIKPDYAEGHFNLGIALESLGRLDESLNSYELALRYRPNYVEALHQRANILRGRGRLQEALTVYDKAIALAPSFDEVYVDRGVALKMLGRLDEALQSYDKAVRLNPGEASSFYNRGITLSELGRLEEALESYERATRLNPMHAAAFYNRGNIFALRKQLKAAVECYDNALLIRPTYAEALNNRSAALYELGNYDQAIKNSEAAIALKPGYVDAINNRGNALKAVNRYGEARESFESAIAAQPDNPESYYNLGVLLAEQGLWREALANYQHTLALDPNCLDASLAVCMAQLPVIYADESEIMARRLAYGDALATLRRKAELHVSRAAWADAIGSSQPFLLAYQAMNDRKLQGLYGSLACDIMASRYSTPVSCPVPAPSERVRVGIVSGFFHRHSNWYIPIKGWLEQLNRDRFSVFGYHTGVTQDSETAAAAQLCERFISGPKAIDDWRAAIIEDGAHVLIYPEVGMDPTAVQLAAQRLAAVQCNSWGHPDTSGFPTLDYFLTSDLMEPANADEHYTEKLVRLPNLSIYYEPSRVDETVCSREELGLRPTSVAYWSGQSLFKYLPQFDYVFPRIAKEVGDCQFVFVEHQSGTHVNEVFLERLETAFGLFDLKANDYCVMLPRLDAQRFVAAIGCCDIVLDSIEWSGCNSTFESLRHDLPIVTYAGKLMRGRHTAATLRMMGCTETIAETVEGYISTAIRLASDRTWRAAVRSAMSRHKHLTYRDRACILALEDFLETAARASGQ